MARLARLTAPGFVHHIVVRGNNGAAVFRDVSDRAHWVDCLRRFSASNQVTVHAYVLLKDEVQLLVTPESTRSVSRMMQAIGRQYVTTFNRKYRQTGTLWEGRYRCSLIQADAYLLPCMVYMDLAPVRAGEVAEASAHSWGSYAHYVGVTQEPWLVASPRVWTLGNTPFAREAAYRDRVVAGLSAALVQTIRDHTHNGWALGDEAFLTALQAIVSRRVSKGKAGRPNKSNPLSDPN